MNVNSPLTYFVFTNKAYFQGSNLFLHRIWVEEVFMKWMDRQSVTEMERVGVYEMDKPKKCQKWKCH